MFTENFNYDVIQSYNTIHDFYYFCNKHPILLVEELCPQVGGLRFVALSVLCYISCSFSVYAFAVSLLFSSVPTILGGCK